MRAGIETSDYREEIPMWKELEKAVQHDRRANEKAAMMRLLKKTDSSSVVSEVKQEQLDADELQAKQLVAEMMKRTRKAYGYLYAALPEELRLLVKEVPQGYAFGIWSFLEKKYQNTEQDNVADLWERFTALEQSSDESFEEYKARVDELRSLLTHAKDTPSHGLYAHRLLWKLQPKYAQAVLALKAGDRIKDAEKINWVDISSFMANHERSQLRLNGVDDQSAERSMAARGGNSSSSNGGLASRKQGVAATDVRCFGCGTVGHIRRFCPNRKNQKQGEWKQPSRRHHREQPSRRHSRSSTASEGSGEEGQAYRSEKANAVRRVAVSNNYDALSSDDESDKDAVDDLSHHSYEPTFMARSFAAVVYAAAQIPSNAKKNPVQQVQSPRPLQRLKRPGEFDLKKKDETAAEKKSSTTAVNKEKEEKMVNASKVRSNTKPLSVALSTTAWGIDTMASVHCTGNRNLLFNFRRCAAVPVEVADGAIVTAMHCGSVDIRVSIPNREKPIRITVEQVYYHERFSANLLSWGSLKQLGWELHSSSDSTYVVTPGKNRVSLSTRGRVAVLDHAPVEHVYRAMRGEVTISTIDEMIRLHERLGHVSYDRVRQICREGKTDGVGRIDLSREQLDRAKKMIMDCTACTQGKGSRTPTGDRGLDRGRAPGEVLHMDTFFTVLRNKEGKKYNEYCLVAVEPHTEFRWTVTTERKDLLTPQAEAIVRHAQTMTGKRVKRVQSDGGGEFIDGQFKRFCSTNGTEWKCSPPHTPKMNGIAEANVRTTKDAARTLLIHANLDDTYWRRAVQHHTFLWNRTRVGRNTGITPMEAMKDQKPSCLHIGVFGCDVFVHRLKSQRDTTFSPKMEPGVYLGHDSVYNCAVVLMLKDGKQIRSRDVEFREGKFEHARALRRGYTQRIIQQRYQPEMDEMDLLDGEEETNSTVSRPTITKMPTVTEEELEKKYDNEHYPPMNDKSDAVDATDDDGDELDQPSNKTDDAVLESDDDSNDQMYEVEDIVGKRELNGETQYRVKWTGYQQPTWEPSKNLHAAKESVNKYEAKQKLQYDRLDKHHTNTSRMPTRSSMKQQVRIARVVEEEEDEDESSADSTTENYFTALAALCAARRL